MYDFSSEKLCGVFGIEVHVASDAQAQRQEWIQQKDAAKAKFRRDCETEVERIK